MCANGSMNNRYLLKYSNESQVTGTELDMKLGYIGSDWCS